MDAQLPRPGFRGEGLGVPCPLSSRVAEGGGDVGELEEIGRKEGSVNNLME